MLPEHPERDQHFVPFPVLHTERLRLRQVTGSAADRAAIYAMYSDPDVMRHFGRAPMTDMAQADEWLARMDARYDLREAIWWGITVHDSDDLLGMCTLHHLDWAHQHAELGYIALRSSWGKSIMREAAAQVLDFAFGTLGFHRVEAIIDPDNARSEALLLRLGFAFEGRLRGRFLNQGKFEDESWFGLVRGSGEDQCRYVASLVARCF